jgi:hypothetical protein
MKVSAKGQRHLLRPVPRHDQDLALMVKQPEGVTQRLRPAAGFDDERYPGQSTPSPND